MHHVTPCTLNAQAELASADQPDSFVDQCRPMSSDVRSLGKIKLGRKSESLALSSLAQSPDPQSTVDERYIFHMDASIFIVGDDDFCRSILKAIEHTGKLSLERAPNPQEADPIIQAQQPDLLIIDARQQGAFQLCQDIKKQKRLAWIYCILVEDVLDSDAALNDKRLLSVAEALEEGADAYIGMPEKPNLAHTRLLRSQVQAGLRRVLSYRELVRTNDLLSAIALSDPLTELNNRRAFEWELPRQIRNARDRSVPISLLMLDVDYFKTINDEHGHLVGDRALRLISARMRHNLRFYDTPFRYGGEEFVIILNNTGAKEAKRIGQRLCNLIAHQPFTVNESLDLHITVSAGTASLRPSDDEKGVSLLQRADQNLLKAKSQGRNQVVSEDALPGT